LKASFARTIQSGRSYEKLFPKPKGDAVLIKKGASVEDTLRLMPKVIDETLTDTARLAKQIKGETLLETCRNAWRFVYNHIQYRPDAFGKEQVRRPARSFSERVLGVDCDCYTVFLVSLLRNLNVRNIILRVTMYPKSTGWQHVYPVVIAPDGSEIIIDCVTNRFNYEVPYTKKLDQPIMDLYYLNGIDDSQEMGLSLISDTSDLSMDASDLLSGSDDLDGLFSRIAEGVKNVAQKVGDGVKQAAQKVGNAVSKGVNAINKVNPATLLLRAGFLAAMKLNLMGVAEKLRFAYLTEAEAKNQGGNIDRYMKLKGVMRKAESIFYKAGGKPDNLKKAILQGKGNADGLVQAAGLSGVSVPDANSPISSIIGKDIWMDEFAADGAVNGTLGEPVTTAAITAAAGVIATLKTIIGKIGDLGIKFKLGRKNQPEQTQQSNTPAKTRFNLRNTTPINVSANAGTYSPETSQPFVNEDTFLERNDVANSPTSEPNPVIEHLKKHGIWYGLGAAGLGVGTFFLVKHLKKKKPTKSGTIDGIPKSPLLRNKRKSTPRKKAKRKPIARPIKLVNLS